MTPAEELLLFVRNVYGAVSSEKGLNCDVCETEHPEGGELFFVNDGKRQIVECCFKKVFGPIKKTFDSRRQWFFEYLLEQFGKNPLDTEWEYIRSRFLPNAIHAWRIAAEKEKINSKECLDKIPIE